MAIAETGAGPPRSRVKPRGALGARALNLRETIVHALLLASALVSVVTTFAIILVLLEETVTFFREISPWDFFTGTKWTPLFTPAHYGVLPLLGGTLLISLVAAAFAVPLGLLTAIFLSEYAPRWLRSIVKPILEVLAGIPTVVLGFFALFFIAEDIIKPLFNTSQVFSGLAAAVAIGIMVIPLVSSLSEDALQSVPRSLREGAYALGATRFEVTRRVVVPAALSGIAASFILAVSRAVGETMIVLLAAGGTPNLTWNPLEAMQTMTAYIAQVSLGDTPQGSIEYDTIFAVGMTLFLMTFGMNILSQYLLHKFREVYE
jgi:phosphate transport system permease protein